MPSPGSETQFPVFGRDDRSLHSYGRSNGSGVNAFNHIQSEDCIEEKVATKQEQDGEPTGKHGKEENKARIVQRRRGRQKSESLLSSLCQFIADHQIGRVLSLPFRKNVPVDSL